MKVVLFLLTALAIMPAAMGAERFFVVEVRDHAGEPEYSVLTAEALRDLESTIRTETALHSRALNLAAGKWEETEANGRYPGGVVSSRKVRRMGLAHADRAQADAALGKLREREANSALRKAEREEARRKRLNRGRTATAANMRKKEARAAERAADRDALYARARQAYVAALAEAMQPEDAKE